MSFSDWIALGGLIVSVLSLLVTVTAGILAILGYRKIIKSTDENAKERKAEMEQSANTIHLSLQEMGKTISNSIKRDKSLVISLMLLMAVGSWWITILSSN